MMHRYESPTRGRHFTQTNGHCVVDSGKCTAKAAVEMNGHVPTLRSLGSPLQLSNKVCFSLILVV